MFNRKSIYALNKKDPNAIVYMDANEVIVRLTREDFASEEEFLKWKSWSDGNYRRLSEGIGILRCPGIVRLCSRRGLLPQH